MTSSKKDIKLVRSLKQKKFRNEFGLFIVEGKKMVEEALASSFQIHSLYTTDVKLHDDSFIQISNKEMEMMSALSSPSSHLAVLYEKENDLKSFSPLPSIVVVLDGIADPGNAGTILRTADWFGIKHVFFTNDCVELYNPKTVQSTMGSLFRMNVYTASSLEIIRTLKAGNYHLTGADMHGKSIYQTHFEEKQALIIGSESHGIREEMQTAIQNYVSIPGEGLTESLNAAIATSIVLSEIYRRKISNIQ